MPALLRTRRLIELRFGGEARLVAVEDAARYRDALGTPLPPGLPDALLEPARDPVGDLVRRYARTHGPFTAADVAARFGLGPAVVSATLRGLAAGGRVIEGEFRPGGHGREWSDAEILRALRHRSLARLRREVEPVEPSVLGRFLVSWHGINRPRRGLDALLDVVEQLQGAPLVASVLERHILPARVQDYEPALLDTLLSAGEVVWIGVEPLGERDGRVALYLADHAPALLPDRGPGLDAGLPNARRASSPGSCGAAPASSPPSTTPPAALPARQRRRLVVADLAWSRHQRHAASLRAFTAAPERGRRAARAAGFRSRRLVPPSAEGRWSAVPVTGRAWPRRGGPSPSSSWPATVW